MAVFVVVLTAAMKALSHQTRSFTNGMDEMGVLQNLRYGADQLDQELRMAGANVTDRQPAVVYAGPSTFSFNADMISNLPGDISAVYVDPDAPAGNVSAFPLGSATTVPMSSPAFVYPLTDFPSSAAETITYWFTPDAATARTDDFLLVRRVNSSAAETLVRGVLAPTTGNFFKYWYLNAPVGAFPTVDSVPTAWGRLAHTASLHGQLPDTGVIARIDLLRAVELRFRVTNQRPGTEERIRSITTTIPLPNVGVKKLQTCGDAPIFTSVVSATFTAGTPPTIRLTWNASVDETAGERDIIRYVIWRRVNGGAWGDPFASLPSGAPPYAFTDSDLLSGNWYQYAVAAQDCTPLLSPQSFSTTTVVP